MTNQLCIYIKPCYPIYMTTNNSKHYAIEDSTNAIKLQPKYPEAFHFRGLAKLSLALKQHSQLYMQSAIQDLNYAKEQCLQLGSYSEYQNVMESYKRALMAQQVLEKELQK